MPVKEVVVCSVLSSQWTAPPWALGSRCVSVMELDVSIHTEYETCAKQCLGKKICDPALL